MSHHQRNPHSSDEPADTSAIGDVNVGAPLALLLMTAYFGFISLGAFTPSVLAVPVFAGGTTTWAFVCGLSVLALGVLLTGIYVFLANRRSAERSS
jgi:uncharacterized membrane protein (DUF485 family)